MMAFDDRSLDEYIDVPQRIADFREQHKGGSLEPADAAMPYHVVRVPNGWCRECIGRRTAKVRGQWGTCPRCSGSGVRSPEEPQEDVYIVYAAAARRTPDDPHPGVGMAWEPYPGRTPYTAGSELQNAETSAWGRAIVAALASDSKRGVASRHEVRNRRAEREPDGGEPPPPPNGHGNPWEQRTPTFAEAIQKEFTRLRVTDRNKRLEYIDALVGRAVTTPVQLTDQEKKDLVRMLSKFKNAGELEAAKSEKLAARDAEAKQEATA